MGKRVFWIVLDSAGIGGAPDAAEFGDFGADTFGSCYKSGELDVPNMEKMGLKNIAGTSFCDPKNNIIGCYCRMHEKSRGKDTTVGHRQGNSLQQDLFRHGCYQGLRQASR